MRIKQGESNLLKSLALFKKKCATDDFNTIKYIVLFLYHVSALSPWNLQETIDITNDPSSSTTVKGVTGNVSKEVVEALSLVKRTDRVLLGTASS